MKIAVSRKWSQSYYVRRCVRLCVVDHSILKIAFQHLDGAESQPLDLRKRADSSPPTSSTTLQFLPIRSSVDGDYTTKLTTNVVKADHHSVVSSRGVLTTTTKTQTPSPKPRKGNYFLIDSLLTPAHSSDLSLDSKVHIRIRSITLPLDGT